MDDRGPTALEVRRIIKAPVARVFEAWTEPRQLLLWWGPRPVRCLEAFVDLRVGGEYRIVNGFPDGKRVTIFGEFSVVTPPSVLVYSWKAGPGSPAPERVTVTFSPRGAGTEVVVRHELVPDEMSRTSHASGWEGCLDGLQRHVNEAW